MLKRSQCDNMLWMMAFKAKHFFFRFSGQWWSLDWRQWNCILICECNWGTTLLMQQKYGVIREPSMNGWTRREVRIFNLSGFRNIMDSVWQSVLHIWYIGRGRRVICSPFNFYDFCRQHQIVLFVVCHGGATAGQVRSHVYSIPNL